MRVTMTEQRTAAPDGVNDTVLSAGETYELPERLALRYLDRGLAVAADEPAEEKAADPVDETKDLGAAEENKGADEAAAEDEPVADAPAEIQPKRRGAKTKTE